MGALKRLNQQGITIFEISIILLILIFVGLSCYAVMRKINDSTRPTYNNTGIRTQDN